MGLWTLGLNCSRFLSDSTRFLLNCTGFPTKHPQLHIALSRFCSVTDLQFFVSVTSSYRLTLLNPIGSCLCQNDHDVVLGSHSPEASGSVRETHLAA